MIWAVLDGGALQRDLGVDGRGGNSKNTIPLRSYMEDASVVYDTHHTAKLKCTLEME